MGHLAICYIYLSIYLSICLAYRNSFTSSCTTCIQHILTLSVVSSLMNRSRQVNIDNRKTLWIPPAPKHTTSHLDITPRVMVIRSVRCPDTPASQTRHISSICLHGMSSSRHCPSLHDYPNPASRPNYLLLRNDDDTHCPNYSTRCSSRSSLSACNRYQ